MKMYKGDLECNAEKHQVPLLEEAGWSAKKPKDEKPKFVELSAEEYAKLSAKEKEAYNKKKEAAEAEGQ